MKFITIDKSIVRDKCLSWDTDYTKDVYAIKMVYDLLTMKLNVEDCCSLLNLTTRRLIDLLDEDDSRYTFVKTMEG